MSRRPPPKRPTYACTTLAISPRQRRALKEARELHRLAIGDRVSLARIAELAVRRYRRALMVQLDREGVDWRPAIAALHAELREIGQMPPASEDDAPQGLIDRR